MESNTPIESAAPADTTPFDETSQASGSDASTPLPKPIKIALGFVGIAILISIANLAFYFYIFSQFPQLPRQGIGLVVMMWMGMALLYALCLTRMIQGKRWARTALTIAFLLALFSLMAQPEVTGDGYPVHFLSGFMTLSMDGIRLHNGLLAFAPSVAIAATQLIGLYFLFLPSAAHWFSSRIESSQ